jgi:ATP-dependent Clp protease ATP-binding subunit ClpA
MPKINVYLPDDLAEAVKDAGVPVSAVCQRALEQAVRRVTAIREIVAGPAHEVPPGAQPFTARAMRILQAAEATTATEGLPGLDGEHLLRALLDDPESLAVRVLGALDISAQQLRAELDRRTAETADRAPGPTQDAADRAPAPTRDAADRAQAPTAASGRLSADLARVFELAINESSGFGHSYIGTEHLLLGLVGESEGVAGRALRSLGADLRVTRRTVAAALAGYGAGFAAHAQRSADSAVVGGASASAAIKAAIQTELEPVLERLERLERLVA